MVATVDAFTTVAVAAASLGDFALAAVVNLKDEAGIRRRRAVVARGVAGGAVGACVGGLAGWHCGQLERGNVVGPVMTSAEVGRKFMEIYRTHSLTQTKVIGVPSCLNHSVMGRQRRVGTVRDAVWAGARASEPPW